MPDGTQRLSDDLVIGIHEVVIELYGADTLQNRRRVYRQRSEVAPAKRLPGLITVGGQVALVKSIAREGLARQAAANIADRECIDTAIAQQQENVSGSPATGGSAAECVRAARRRAGAAGINRKSPSPVPAADTG